MNNFSKKNSGFTLIELLLAMGILAFLASASVAILGNFNQKQGIKIAYDDVKNGLAQAKSYALSQVVSDECDVNNPDKDLRDEIIGYEVRFDTSSSTKHTYAIYEICEDPLDTEKDILPVSTYDLPKDVFFSTTPAAPSPIRFFVLTGGAENNQTVTIETDAQTRTINVDRNGVIR